MKQETICCKDCGRKKPIANFVGSNRITGAEQYVTRCIDCRQKRKDMQKHYRACKKQARPTAEIVKHITLIPKVRSKTGWSYLIREHAAYPSVGCKQTTRPCTKTSCKYYHEPSNTKCVLDTINENANGMTLAAIGRDLGISRERTRRIVEAVCEKLQKHFGKELRPWLVYIFDFNARKKECVYPSTPELNGCKQAIIKKYNELFEVRSTKLGLVPLPRRNSNVPSETT